MTPFEKTYIDNFLAKLNFYLSSLKHKQVDIKNLEHIEVKKFEQEFLSFLNLLQEQQPHLYKMILLDLKNNF
jgi:helix-turn-helix protein